MKKMQVWRKVRREECFQATGRASIKLRWVDINKGDKLHPKYRSTIVAKETQINNRFGVLAARPPLDFIEYLISRFASRQRRSRPSRLMIQDISKAYFFAPATRDRILNTAAISAAARRRKAATRRGEYAGLNKTIPEDTSRRSNGPRKTDRRNYPDSVRPSMISLEVNGPQEYDLNVS